MRIAVDMHVHLYPYYDAHALFTAAARNLHAAAPTADRFAFYLTDRAGQHAFRELRAGSLTPPVWHLQSTPDPHALRFSTRDGRHLLVLAARQIVTRDRLEVLALGIAEEIADGAPAAEVVARIRVAGALPVLPWGLGKWLGARGRLVRSLIESAKPGELAVADTCLRPALLGDSALLRAARARNLPVLAGTDPLPRLGEEEMAGRFGVLVEGAFEEDRAAVSLTGLLSRAGAHLQTVGRRCSLGEAFSRAW